MSSSAHRNLTLSSPSRIWVFGQATFRPDGSNQETSSACACDTSATPPTRPLLAASVEAWDSKTPAGDADTVMQVATGGLLETGDS